MKIVHFTEIDPVEFPEPAKGVKGRVLVGKKDGAENFCMRLFELPPGAATPRHSHAWEHEIFIHAGFGEIYKEGEWVPVRAGAAAFIPGEEEHQLRCSGETPLFFVCLIPDGPPEL
ncbi:Cupin domain protein [Desulfatibacillum alkenivorans DSM 16219]|jgi:quercetin dioxygenase-like cupin family protein|uniref:Cupin domain protein n=1 Tax=Desulfatibacillum alkenivorans DSM 16219 TaxID=1121393 RepID=A0A1M6P3L5_9BACT|nr:cupin domain-containing protein [Desulfatibacillum alkenivorans]SHK02518.1 Cupin domain protein [Desulfatibacillum alkenivorans DSM 16219]